MRSPFTGGYRVTQAFGVNASYYSKFGLKAHEGIDLVPKDARNTVVYALADGIVVRDEDNARSGAYGIYCTVWHPTLKKATQYCHLASNTVANGQNVRAGEKLGTMGSTGNSTGPHLHLNLFETDENGIRLNRDNGYLGGINPLPFLEEGGESMVQVEAAKFEELVTKASQYDEFVKAGYSTPDKVRKKLEDADRTIANLNDAMSKANQTIVDKDWEIAKLTADVESLEETEEGLAEKTAEAKTLKEQLEQATADRKLAYQSVEEMEKSIARERKAWAEREAELVNSPVIALLSWIKQLVSRKGGDTHGKS